MDGQLRDLNTNPLDQAQRFVVLALDEVALILAQQEIQALEPVLDVKPVDAASAEKNNRAAGMLSLADGTSLVYALDGELRQLAKIPESHRICAIMNYREQRYALSCKEVRLAPRSALGLHEIPRPL